MIIILTPTTSLQARLTCSSRSKQEGKRERETKCSFLGAAKFCVFLLLLFLCFVSSSSSRPFSFSFSVAMSSRQQRNRKQVQRLGDTDWSSETVRGPHATLDPACHRNKPQHKRPGRPKDKLKAEPPKSSALPPTTLTPKERAAKRSRVVDCLDPYTNLKTAGRSAPKRTFPLPRQVSA